MENVQNKEGQSHGSSASISCTSEYKSIQVTGESEQFHWDLSVSTSDEGGVFNKICVDFESVHLCNILGISRKRKYRKRERET